MEDGRIIMNANLGCTNIMGFEDFSEITIDTLKHIIKSISPLCGVDALHDLVVYRDKADQYMSNIFSNDGIHILKKIEYLSPIQTYIANYIRYIAERVERAAADGTSTAIYLASNLIISTFNEVSKIRANAGFCTSNSVIDTNLPVDEVTRNCRIMNKTNLLANQVVYLLRDLLEHVNTLRIDLKQISPTLKNTLISKLANTTSKGNEVLTKYAVELFSDLPELLYEYTSYRKSELETKDDFIIENPEHDLVITVSPSNNTIYNSKLGTELYHENCDLLICPQLYDTMDYLMEYLCQRDESQKTNLNIWVKESTPLIIVYNGINDVDLSKLERIAGRNVVLCRYLMYHPAFLNNPLELNVAQVISGKKPAIQKNVDEFSRSVIHNVKCRIYGKELFVYGLFDNEGSIIHPAYFDETNSDYHLLRKSLEERINELKQSHTKNAVAQELNEFVRIYRNLICSKLPILTIGGSTVNHLSNINVVDDVLGVVSVAMKHGVVLDVLPKLQTALFNKTFVDVPSWKTHFRETVEEFCKLTYRNRTVCTKLENVYESFDELKNFIFDQTECEWEILDDDNINKVVVVQSYRAITETLTRLIETIPRLICTDQVIVQNSVVDNKKE